jgi:hypothetical protein
VLIFWRAVFTSSIGFSWTAAGGTGRAHQTLLRPWSPGKLAEIDSRAVIKRLTSGVMASPFKAKRADARCCFPTCRSRLHRASIDRLRTLKELDLRGRAQAASRTVRRLASVSFSDVDSTPKTSELCASAWTTLSSVKGDAAGHLKVTDRASLKLHRLVTTKSNSGRLSASRNFLPAEPEGRGILATGPEYTGPKRSNEPTQPPPGDYF